jgi:hypothetical protein
VISRLIYGFPNRHPIKILSAPMIRSILAGCKMANYLLRRSVASVYHGLWLTFIFKPFCLRSIFKKFRFMPQINRLSLSLCISSPFHRNDPLLQLNLFQSGYAVVHAARFNPNRAIKLDPDVCRFLFVVCC